MSSKNLTSSFLPMSRAEMSLRGWTELDILLVSGDAYVDHPSFGIALLGRLLEQAGYRVGIIAQPRWDSLDDIQALGRPRLFCGISAGSMDSMLCHYTAFRKKRSDDPYTPGGKAGARPNRASIVYTNLVKRAFPNLFVLLGGIEASLRRFAHYDFWSDSLRRSILLDSKADMIIYGMGERALLELADRMNKGEEVTGIPGTVRISEDAKGAKIIPSYEEILTEKTKLLRATKEIEQAMHEQNTALAQKHANKYVFSEKTSAALSEAELDALYALPFKREAHPSYKERIPALDIVKWSITALRGCAGACSFCSISLHQGRYISSRTKASLQKEIASLRTMKGWKGNISDVGGPTANLWGASCKIDGKDCKRESCLAPQLCQHLELKQSEYLQLLRSLSKEQTVRNVAVNSGVRFDIALKDKNFAEGLTAEYVSGQLKLAPEHCDNKVLKLMRKTKFELFEKFHESFNQYCRKHKKEQYIVPYVMSAFPGTTMKDMQKLAEWFRKKGWKPQQAQCFVPTPGTMATAMYYSEHNSNYEKIYVPKTDREREDQHAVLFKKRRR